MNLNTIVEEERQNKFTADVAAARKTQRERFYLEYLYPVLIAFRTSVESELHPLVVVERLFSYHTSKEQVSFQVKLQTGGYRNGIPFMFGVLYDSATGQCFFAHYQSRWNESDYPNGHKFPVLVEWPDWDEAKFVEQLRKAWAHVIGHLDHYTRASRMEVTNNFWAHTRFTLQTD